MDNLKKIDEVTFEILSELLFKIVPEYQMLYEMDNKKIDLSTGVYLFMNEFALFLVNELQADPTSKVVNKAFIFINRIGESCNLEIINILKVGVLEILYTSKFLDRKMISDFLDGKQKKYFEEFSIYYH